MTSNRPGLWKDPAGAMGFWGEAQGELRAEGNSGWYGFTLPSSVCSCFLYILLLKTHQSPFQVLFHSYTF